MVKAEMSPDNASILVCGGGGIALDVTRKLKDMGAWVWMLQRSDSRRYEHAPIHIQRFHTCFHVLGSRGGCPFLQGKWVPAQLSDHTCLLLVASMNAVSQVLEHSAACT